MTIRHSVVVGVAAVVISLTSGCKSQSASQTPIKPQAAQGQAAPISLAKGDAQEPADGSVDALTRKTQDYTREMSPLISARTSPPSSASPSGVQWVDPAEMRLGSGDNAAQVANGHAEVLPVASHRSNIKTVNDIGTASPSAPAGPGMAGHPGTSAKNDNTMVATASEAGGGSLPLRTAINSDALEDRLSRRIKEYPRDTASQLEYQLLEFLKDEPTPQLAVLSSLPPEDREVVTAILDGLTNFRNALRADNNMLLSKKVKPILEMAERLRSQSDLTIPTIQLCTRVYGFGSYDPIEPARLQAGVDNAVIVYCEVANFASNLNDKQQWETRLTWDLNLYAEAGMSVWSDKRENITDTPRNRRHDFFVRKVITLPKTLPIGRYLLKASIVDTQSNRVAEATLPLVIAAQAGQ